MPISPQELILLKTLHEMEITYERFEHPPVMTVEEASQFDGNIPGARCKNLFLRDKSGKNHLLVIALAETIVDLSILGKLINKNHLSFASPERLMKFLGLLPGAVSPFGLMNDHNHEVQIVLDTALLREKTAGFHPNVNTATLMIPIIDLRKFISVCKNSVIEIDFSRTDYLVNHSD